DIAGGQPLLGGIRTAVDADDDHALDAVLDLVLAAQILAERREIESERLLRHRLLGGRLVLGLGRGLLGLVGILEAAERHFPGFLRALAEDHDRASRASRRVGYHAP